MGPSKSSSHPVIAETFKCFFSGSSPLLNTHSSGVANGSHISWCDSRITLILENITSRIYDTCFWRPSIWVTRGWNCRFNHGLRRKKKVWEEKKLSDAKPALLWPKGTSEFGRGAFWNFPEKCPLKDGTLCYFPRSSKVPACINPFLPTVAFSQPIFAHRSNICCPIDWRLSA